MSDLRVAVIADCGHVQKFGRDALDSIEGCEEIAVYSCTNTRTRKQIGRHAAYYALNLLAVRNAMSRSVPVAGGRKRVAREVSFESEWDGAWQALPAAIVEELRGFDVVIKLGMGLLRVPDTDRLPVPILSYHHGDPDHYRGRPAGFWEMSEGSPVIGQIVQAIGNRLDAGRVLAFAETKVHPHSYRATLIESYRHSPLIINEAIRRARSGEAVAKPSNGRNCRLPSNLAVATFVAKMAARFVRRLLYGAFMEKNWRVSTAPAPEGGAASLFEGAGLREPWRTVTPAKGYSFYADPFYSAEPLGLLVEALNRRTGLGEILLVAEGEHRRISDWRGHASYPATIETGGRQLVVPETASAAPAAAYALEGGKLVRRFELDLPGAPRLLDPTLLEHEGRMWLFANDRAVGANALFLWSADRLDGRFEPHPMSPVRITPEGSRMAGLVLRDGARMIRLGQDFRFGYGDGIVAFEIVELSTELYSERKIGALTFADRGGPHTLNVRGGELLFDWYRDRFAPGAGVRRLLARLRRTSAR